MIAFPTNYKLIAEGPTKIYRFKHNRILILAYYAIGVINNSLIVKIGVQLHEISITVPKAQFKDIFKIKRSIITYIIFLIIRLCLSNAMVFWIYYQWQDFGYKESGKYIFIDEFSDISFEYEKISGGSQPKDINVTVYAFSVSVFMGGISCLI
mmetsp:Transcript_32861/g.29158  ORF Transcript_32861/g.29158 Transcript_32861/m.29158 type:complete len:153 (+) Transcript_32861:285-743(+)